MSSPEKNKFSNELESWLKSEGKKTLGKLEEHFAEETFAIAILLLMAVPALPVPTGGITHVLQIITLVLATQIFLGRKNVWIPSRWKNFSLSGRFQQKGLRGLLKFIRFFEKFSQPRWEGILSNKYGRYVFASLISIFTIFAFIAPPFSGLDTLPSLGVVILCLSAILKDSLLSIVGLLVGSTGAVLILVLGKAVYDGVLKFI